MGTKENFNQAMHEVFPFMKNAKGSGTSAGINSTNLAEQVSTDSKTNEPIDFQSVYDTKRQQNIETTHITKDTKITGTITSKSNIDIGGDVFGDVESQNSINISGKIEGNVSGKNVEINNAIIRGNIHVSERLNITNQSEIVGDIFANQLEFNSKINGNINVKKDINIQKESTIVGDITAMSMGIEKGAVIKSMVNITGERKMSSEENPE